MPVSIEVIDMLGRIVKIPKPIQRVVSLVPSQTEFLYDLGLKDKIVAQTVFCIHPKSHFKKATKIGGTKKIRYDELDELQPDLIICNKEENNEEIVETLSKKYPVWVSDIKNIDDAFYMMRSLAELFDAKSQCDELIKRITMSLNQKKVRHQYNCVYLIWRNPYMSVGYDTFINHMLQRSGFNNLINVKRYPELSSEELQALNPEVVLLSSEPYPFKEKHIEELKTLLPNSKILMVDGELFSWYGSRLLNSQPYFNELQRQLHKIKR
jgi:ABC-type Fe3+-hydroxamate transport system substrate-binding protein